MTQYDVAPAEHFTQELTEFVERSDFCYRSKIVNGGIAGIVGRFLFLILLPVVVLYFLVVFRVLPPIPNPILVVLYIL